MSAISFISKYLFFYESYVCTLTPNFFNKSRKPTVSHDPSLQVKNVTYSFPSDLQLKILTEFDPITKPNNSKQPLLWDLDNIELK